MRNLILASTALLIAGGTAVAFDAPEADLESYNAYIELWMLTNTDTSDDITSGAEKKNFTLEPYNPDDDCSMLMGLPTIIGSARVPEGCGDVTATDGTTGKYIYLDDTQGNFLWNDRLFIELDDGTSYNMRNPKTATHRNDLCPEGVYTKNPCDPGDYLFCGSSTPGGQNSVRIDDTAGTKVSVGKISMCFDGDVWEL